MKLDYTKKPFNLTSEDIRWVEKTLAGMSLERKVAHLFCILIKDKSVDDMISEMRALDFVPGSYMSDVFPARKVRENFSKLQAETDIPLLFACNLERGADGICTEGTYYGTQMQSAATGDPEFAYELGRVSAEEARACGANWNFGPVVDIDADFHNPITNTRTFSSDLETVIAFSKAFIRGQSECGIASCVKHWPGDGQDERDQHMVVSINSLGADEWMESYGRIYSECFDLGAESIMAAQIMQPAWSRRLNPDLRDQDILPGSLSYELTTTLLREKLGFNGLVVTDATTMSGYMLAMAREEALPASINAGCDVLLFAADTKADYEIMLNAVRSGKVSLERLDEAVSNILALKAHLGLPKKMSEGKLFVPESELSCIGSEKNAESARKCADAAVTLVKDTSHTLPLDPAKYKRVLLHVLGDKGGYHDYVKGLHKYFKEKLENEGFEVTIYDPSKPDMLPIGNSVESFVKRFDLVIYYCSVKTSGADTVSRITWSVPGGCNTPRYFHEIPYVFISMDNPYMLFDVPTLPTYINAYTPSKIAIDAVIEKLMGRSPFKGKSPVDPFCGLFNSRF